VERLRYDIAPEMTRRAGYCSVDESLKSGINNKHQALTVKPGKRGSSSWNITFFYCEKHEQTALQ
jgi:hypothetical protein